MVKLQLHLVSVLLHAGQVSADEERKTEAEEEAKGEMQRTIEKYVGKQNDEELESDQIWDEDRKTFVHQAFSILNTLHGNVPKNHPLRCEWMYLMGRALHLMGESTHPDPPDYQWNIYDYVSEQVLSPVEVHNSLEHIDSITSVAEQDEDQTDEEEDSFMVRQQQKRNDEAGKILHSSDMTSRLLSHASEVLAQCIHLALPMQDWVIISKAALEMVECCAQFDPATAALYLSLHQSAETSRSMKELLLKALSDPSNSQFASLVQQEAWLMKQYVTTGMHASSMRKNVLKILEETYIAWKRIQLSPNYLNLMRDLPPGLNIVILQHSPDQKMLYCAILDKTKAQAPQSESKKGKEKPVSSSTVRSRAFISRVKMDPNFYNDLTDLREDFLQRFMSFLLQNEYQVYQLEMRKRMLQQLSKNSAEPAISETALEEQEEEEAKLKEEFQSILDDMESYLAPITSQLQAKLIQPIIDQGMENINNHLTVTDSELLVLLADPALMHLPLEALKCLQTPFIDSVSRDFSLQFLHRRWFIDPDAAAAAEKKKADAKGQPKTAKGARDPGKKQGGAPSAKVVPINRDIPQGCRAVDTHGIRYVVDPHDECSETEEHRPEQVFKQLLHMYHQSFTPRWSGKFGSDGDPSTGQWEEALLAGSSFIYYGMEKFISQFPPSKLSTMDLRQCQIALLLDKSQTHTSFQHQSKVDVEKTNCLLSIEKPLETAMLLSLAGVNSVCINQWHSTTEDNASKLQKIFKFILEEGKMVGIAIRNITNPSLKKPDPPPISPEPPRSGKKLKDGGRGSRGSGRTATASKSNDGIHPSAHPVENSMDTVNEEESLNVTEEVEEEVPPFILDASHCNMILFGLPNFVVA